MPFISIIMPTMRAGGIDIVLESLKRQTYSDFELVLVDGLYEYRRERIQQEARDRFLRVVHVGLTPNPFPVCAFCAYSNAGIVASSGEVLLFAVDYSRFPSSLVGAHAAFHRMDPTGRAAMMAPHRYIGLDVHPDFPRYGRNDVGRYENDVKAHVIDKFMWSIGGAKDEPSAPFEVDGGAIAMPNADPKLAMPPGPIDCGYFHAKNESVRRERALEVNGWDPELDGAHLYQDSDFADRLTVKAGVRWMLDPSQVVEIANPRHVFPFARRLRPHETNRDIWQRKKAAGYPQPGKPLHEIPVHGAEPVSSKVSDTRDKKFRVAMIYGEFSSAIHGPFDINGLYKTSGLTGSESSFFNLARTLAERGHEVVVFCRCEVPILHPSGFTAMPIPTIRGLPKMEDLDAVIAWNEPDYLQFVPPGVPTFVDQQLNDWDFVQNPNWQKTVANYVFPSQNSKQHHLDIGQIDASRPASVIPNSVDLGLFSGDAPKRDLHSVVYCSSPDRGLHHLLSFWPLVRKRVPDATLKIFYRIEPWLARVLGAPDEVGKRARFIAAAIPKLMPMGVKVVGPVPNITMAEELQRATVLAYPCDPVSYTEGFGCSVLDAAAGGCIPIISDADALPSVHGNAASVVKGKPGASPEVWAETIANTLLLGQVPPEWKTSMAAHAAAHSREKITDQWEALLGDRC